MTVSPRWPQDDSAMSSADDHPLAADSGAESNMPPTLFRLPNLNPAPKAPDPEPVLAIPTTPAASPVAISPAAPDAAAVGTPATDTFQQRDSRQGDSQSQDAIPSQTFYERPAPIDDSPAGRSWMEVTRQHGVVVMLLLVVIATAIFTGRDPNIDLANDAIADAVDMGQIDDGIASDVPLPVHHHDSETGVASSNDSATSFATLEPPQVGVAQEGTGIRGNETTSDVTNKQDTVNEVATIELVPSQVDARTVANRVANTTEVDSDVAFNPPSLESLAESLSDGDPELTDEMSEIQANSFVPVLSKTPNGISNWLNLLPALPNDTSN